MTGLPNPTRGTWRVWRGGMLALVSATLAVAAHAVAGGGVPAVGWTLLLTIGVAVAGIAMANRRRSIGAILLVLGTAQLAIHLLLSLGTPDMPGMPGMEPATTQFSSTAMISAHTIAVLVTALVLARADAAVFTLASVLARLLPTVLIAPPVPAAPVRLRPAATPRVHSTGVLLCRDNARRGPPVAA
jgi:hypothetical protein